MSETAFAVWKHHKLNSQPALLGVFESFSDAMEYRDLRISKIEPRNAHLIDYVIMDVDYHPVKELVNLSK